MTKKNVPDFDSGIYSHTRWTHDPASDDGNDIVFDEEPYEMEHAARADTARYIERMAADLCIMATASNLNFLAYLLDMVRMEAHDRARMRR